MADFTLYTYDRGPNGWKVVYVLEKLDLIYEAKYLDFDKNEHKSPEFLKINPNGRIPALIDHRANNFTIWESNAIMLYLTGKYDKEHKISARTEEEKYEELQWLFFQGTGQGPYYGQAAHFASKHPEKIPSVIQRYVDEVDRVQTVLDGILSQPGRKWLLSGREDGPTISDLAWVPWNHFGTIAVVEWAATTKGEEVDVEKRYPNFMRWRNAMLEDDVVKKAAETRTKLLGARGIISRH